MPIADIMVIKRDFLKKLGLPCKQDKEGVSSSS